MSKSKYGLKFGLGLLLLLFFTKNIEATGLTNQVRLIATGDVIPARSVNSTMVKLNNFTYPFAKTVSLFNKADLVFINLEAPLINNCPVTNEGMIFCGSSEFIQGLKYAHVTVANLANNHSGNYGNQGIEETVKLLNKNQIKTTGLGKPVFIKIKGLKFAFLGYNDIEQNPELKIASASPQLIEKQIKNAKKRADFVIVAFHWGDEYTAQPNQFQKNLAHLAIDNGADLIIGNHPHWVQSREKYKGKVINYALGNFVFDQMWSDKTREGIIGWYVFNKKGLVKTKYYPIVIENYAQPRFAKNN